MATAWDLLVSNSHLNEEDTTSAITYLQNSVKYVKATTLNVKDAKTEVNTEDSIFDVFVQDTTNINVDVTDVSINVKDNVNVNKEI